MSTLQYVLDTFGIKSYPNHTWPIEVRNFGRNDLAKLFAELGFVTGVEIGVKQGEYSEVLCQANPNLRLHSIDPWNVEAYDLTVKGVPNMQAAYDKWHEEAKKRLKPYKCTIVKARSMEAVEWFEDESFDFVYIDGNHNFLNCTLDITEWTKKVRPGGIISGHDFTRYPLKADIHVKQVVGAYTAAYGIIPWFVLGIQRSGEPGITRDKSRSWFWVKK